MHALNFFFEIEIEKFFERISHPGPCMHYMQLMEKYQITKEQLNRKVEQTHIPILAEFFDGVDMYVDLMKLTEAEKSDVKRDFNSKGTQVAMTNCLSVWKQHDSLKATYGSLLSILMNLKKGGIADKVCEHLVKSICEVTSSCSDSVHIH